MDLNIKFYQLVKMHIVIKYVVLKLLSKNASKNFWFFQLPVLLSTDDVKVWVGWNQSHKEKSIFSLFLSIQWFFQNGTAEWWLETLETDEWPMQFWSVISESQIDHSCRPISSRNKESLNAAQVSRVFAWHRETHLLFQGVKEKVSGLQYQNQ